MKKLLSMFLLFFGVLVIGLALRLDDDGTTSKMFFESLAKAGFTVSQ